MSVRSTTSRHTRRNGGRRVDVLGLVHPQRAPTEKVVDLGEVSGVSVRVGTPILRAKDEVAWETLKTTRTFLTQPNRVSSGIHMKNLVMKASKVTKDLLSYLFLSMEPTKTRLSRHFAAPDHRRRLLGRVLEPGAQ